MKAINNRSDRVISWVKRKDPHRKSQVRDGQSSISCLGCDVPKPRCLDDVICHLVPVK
jgi:hypothetical protein